MSDTYGMGEALLALEAENPMVYAYSGTEYPCIRGDATIAKTLGMGGYAPAADVVVVVRNEAIPAGVGLKSEIVVEGTTYLLDSYQQDPNQVFQVWALSDPQKAA